MSRRHDCPALRAAYAELLDLKKRCKLAIEEAKRTGDLGPARNLISLCRQKIEELGQQVSPIWERVDVTYKMPSMKELEKRFDYVRTVFDGRPWEPIEACKHISREPRKIRFEYFHVDQKSTTAQVLVEMEKQGLRPALPEELICFAQHYPDAQREGWIVALGSSAMFDDDRCVAVLDNVSDWRVLDCILHIGGWDQSRRFLCVRKEE